MHGGWTIAARHAGVVLGLLLLTPIFTTDLHKSERDVLASGTAAILDSRIPPLDKITVARHIALAVDDARQQARIPDVSEVVGEPLRAVAGSETRASLLTLVRCGQVPAADARRALPDRPRGAALGWPRRRGLAAGAAQVDGDAPLRPQVARVCEPHAGLAEPRHQPGRRIVGRRSARPPHGLRSPPAPHRQGHGNRLRGAVRRPDDGDVQHVQRDARLIFAVGKELAEQAPERGDAPSVSASHSSGGLLDPQHPERPQVPVHSHPRLLTSLALAAR